MTSNIDNNLLLKTLRMNNTIIRQQLVDEFFLLDTEEDRNINIEIEDKIKEIDKKIKEIETLFKEYKK